MSASRLANEKWIIGPDRSCSDVRYLASKTQNYVLDILQCLSPAYELFQTHYASSYLLHSRAQDRNTKIAGLLGGRSSKSMVELTKKMTEYLTIRASLELHDVDFARNYRYKMSYTIVC